jgi:hypothetical protein
MRFGILFLSAFLALMCLVSAKKDKVNEIIKTNKHKKELFRVNLIETKSYKVEGHTCEVEMIFIEGNMTGKYFNGDLIFKDSTNVVKRYRNGKVEATARFFVSGKDNNNNVGHLHFEDIQIGYDNKNHAITRPNIFTDVQTLAWLPKADVIGIVEKTKTGKVIRYMWNEKNTTEKPYRAPEFPDETKNYNVPVLTIDVIPGGLGFDGFYGVDGTGVGKLGFTCAVNTTEFQGHSVDYFVDTRYDVMGQAQGVSARYIIEGVDKEGTPMKIYVENNGVDDNGDNLNVRTEPIIITDNPKWAWIEYAPLHGTHEMIDGFSFIYFWTVEGANQPIHGHGHHFDSDSDSSSSSSEDSD